MLHFVVDIANLYLYLGCISYYSVIQTFNGTLRCTPAFL